MTWSIVLARKARKRFFISTMVPAPGVWSALTRATSAPRETGREADAIAARLVKKLLPHPGSVLAENHGVARRQDVPGAALHLERKLPRRPAREPREQPVAGLRLGRARFRQERLDDFR